MMDWPSFWLGAATLGVYELIAGGLLYLLWWHGKPNRKHRDVDAYVKSQMRKR